MKIIRPAGDGTEAHAEFSLHKRLEAPAVTVRRVEPVVVTPGDGPVVAALGQAPDRRGRCPLDAPDDRARRTRRLGFGLLHRRDDRIEERRKHIVMPAPLPLP